MSELGEHTRWSGWELPDGGDPPTAEELARLLATEGGDGYQLLAVAGRGFRPPRYLTVAPSRADARSTGADDSSEDPGPLRRSWTVRYRRIAETRPAGPTRFAIYLLGVDPPKSATDTELEVFNAFYTDVHLREVAERRSALRAERYERDAAITSPIKGAPRYLAVYEFDEEGASRRRHTGPPYSSGPEVWQGHTTPWRLWYRRIAP